MTPSRWLCLRCPGDVVVDGLEGIAAHQGETHDSAAVTFEDYRLWSPGREKGAHHPSRRVPGDGQQTMFGDESP